MTNPEVQNIADEIRSMKKRGAGEIARSAADALRLTAESSTATSPAELVRELRVTSQLLLATRPTAVSLPNAVRFVMHRVTSKTDQKMPVADLRAVVVKAAEEFTQNSFSAVQRIGEIGAKRIRDGDTILTHCNSSTVVAILGTAWKQGKRFEVVATETRPRFQGRLTAKELGSIGIPVTLILDDAVRFFLNAIDKVFVGADAVTANGALVNKIGTSLVALAAHEARVRLFVAAETYKFSPETLIGELIEIEERDISEIIKPEELKQIPNTRARNPAFDITPAEYIDLIITEKGIIPPQAAILILEQEFGLLTPEELGDYHTVRISEQK